MFIHSKLESITSSRKVKETQEYPNPSTFLQTSIYVIKILPVFQKATVVASIDFLVGMPFTSVADKNK